MELDEVIKAAEMQALNLPPNMLKETAKAIGLHKLILAPYMDLWLKIQTHIHK